MQEVRGSSPLGSNHSSLGGATTCSTGVFGGIVSRGFINQKGEVAIKPQYHWVDNFSEGLAWVQGGEGNEGYIDKTGKLVIKQRFWDTTSFSDGRAAVVLQPGGAFGLIDKIGKVVAQPRFDEVCLFSEGLAAVRVQYPEDSKWGYIDTSGANVIEPRFDEAESFSGGLAEVWLEHKSGYIDKTGRFVWGPKEVNFGDPEDEAFRRLPFGPRYQSQIAGPRSVPAKQVALVGNPFRERYPDGTPLVFSRNLRDMILYQGRIYIGSGDFWSNTGPIDIYSFEPGHSKFTLEHTVPEEMVSKFYIFDDKLVIPGDDPWESWDLGNLYIKESGKWRKLRTIPHGVLCHELAYLDGRLFAGVGTEHTLTVLKSTDWGNTWKPIIFDTYPGCLFTSGGKVHGFSWSSTEHLCTLEDGIFMSERMVPRYLTCKSRFKRDTPPYSMFYRICSVSDAVPFVGGVFAWSSSAGERNQVCPPKYFAAGEAEGAVVQALVSENATDAAVVNGTLYVLCTRRQKGTYENAVYSTQDVRTWRCIATFTTKSFARSLVAADAEFYVSIGCRFPGSDSDPLPASTGDILRVTPQ